jgi:predicted ATPase
MEDPNKVPAVTRFAIRGLYGYKDIQIKMHTSTKIVIAENGTGKTTVLNALYAFLKKRFHRLSRIDFRAIECDIGGKTLELNKEDVALPSMDISPSIRTYLEEAGIKLEDMLEWAVTEFDGRPFDTLRTHPYVERLYRMTDMGFSEVEGLLRGLLEEYKQKLPDKVNLVVREINDRLPGVQPVYLPTYRRIEIPSTDYTGNRPRMLRSRNMPLADDAQQIYFGLTDVENRLKGISEEIVRKSNIGYRTVSANIIDDLLSKRHLSSPHSQLPEIATLGLFFARVSQPQATNAILGELSKLYTQGEIDDQSNQILRWFLGRLTTVVNETRDIERQLEKFIEIVNVFLRQASDSKELFYDPLTTKISVKSEWTSEGIRLDDLSSGEKQVISLLAQMYLDRVPKIILIDEPELSLSLDWQRILLPNIVKAPSCQQLLAITHSPFIFENELDPFAGTLDIHLHREQ